MDQEGRKSGRDRVATAPEVATRGSTADLGQTKQYTADCNTEGERDVQGLLHSISRSFYTRGLVCIMGIGICTTTFIVFSSPRFLQNAFARKALFFSFQTCMSV